MNVNNILCCFGDNFSLKGDKMMVLEQHYFFSAGEDRRELELLSGNLVRGMGYPFGNNNDSVVEIIRSLGIEYARTVKDTYSFGIPDEFLQMITFSFSFPSLWDRDL